MTKANEQAGQPQPEQSVESIALAGAAAIQRLIADRDSFRNRASAQEREMNALRAANEDLRRRLVLVRQHYVEVATKILAQLEHLDGATRDAMGDMRGAAQRSGEDSNLVALVQRLSPNNGQGRSANTP